MLIKDQIKRCTWDYIFSAPITKDGEYTSDFHIYDSNQNKQMTPLQPLDFNVNYANTHTPSY